MSRLLVITIADAETGEVLDILHTDESANNIAAALKHGCATYDTAKEYMEANQDRSEG
jgi:TusA-related sulfurtransferase